jgi:hypothetical protein
MIEKVFNFDLILSNKLVAFDFSIENNQFFDLCIHVYFLSTESHCQKVNQSLKQASRMVKLFSSTVSVDTKRFRKEKWFSIMHQNWHWRVWSKDGEERFNFFKFLVFFNMTKNKILKVETKHIFQLNVKVKIMFIIFLIKTFCLISRFKDWATTRSESVKSVQGSSRPRSSDPQGRTRSSRSRSTKSFHSFRTSKPIT